jgi:hypothetical protein
MKELVFAPVYHLPTLVIEMASGVNYLFQVGGSIHWEKSVQGIVYPIAASGFVGAETLGDRLNSIAHELISITDVAADKIDALFEGAIFMDLKVDRSKLLDSCDSWVHMTLLRADEWILHGFDFPLGCILTW